MECDAERSATASMHTRRARSREPTTASVSRQRSSHEGHVTTRSAEDTRQIDMAPTRESALLRHAIDESSRRRTASRNAWAALIYEGSVSLLRGCLAWSTNALIEVLDSRLSSQGRHGCLKKVSQSRIHGRRYVQSGWEGTGHRSLEGHGAAVGRSGARAAGAARCCHDHVVGADRSGAPRRRPHGRPGPPGVPRVGAGPVVFPAMHADYGRRGRSWTAVHPPFVRIVATRVSGSWSRRPSTPHGAGTSSTAQPDRGIRTPDAVEQGQVLLILRAPAGPAGAAARHYGRCARGRAGRYWSATQ